MTCTTLGMEKMSYRDGRKACIPGLHQDLLQYLEMDVELLEATHMGAYAKRGLLTTATGTMTGPMGLVVIYRMKRYILTSVDFNLMANLVQSAREATT